MFFVGDISSAAATRNSLKTALVLEAATTDDSPQMLVGRVH